MEILNLRHMHTYISHPKVAETMDVEKVSLFKSFKYNAIASDI